MPTTNPGGRALRAINGRRDTRPPNGADHGRPGVAFYTIVSHDTDPNPQVTVMAQYAARTATLGFDQLWPVYFDIQGTPSRPARQVTAIKRDGGLAELLREAISPKRRFNRLVTPGLAWLERHDVQVHDVLRHLDRAGIAYVVTSSQLANELGYPTGTVRLTVDPALAWVS